MDYSINYNKGSLKGWVDSEDPNNTEIRIFDSLHNLYFTKLGLIRKDVVSKARSKNLNCGFSYEDIIQGDIEGNFFSYEIQCNSNIASGSKFCGDYEKWMDTFDSFHIHDRKDFSIQEKPIEEIFSNYPDLIAFKLLLIRLRRGKRGFGGRASFKGHDYPLIQEDWLFFKSFYTRHFDTLSKILSVRSLWSVIDTFADFGTAIEQACALAVSNYLYQERFAQTYSRVFELVPLNKIKLGQSLYWGGMLTNRLHKDDSYDVFFTRNILILEHAPIIKKTFGIIFLQSILAENSINSMNLNNSEWFIPIFDFYKKYFTKYIDGNKL